MIVRRVTKNHKVTFKHVKAFFTLAIVSVHESIISLKLNNNGVHGRVSGRKTLLFLPIYSLLKIIWTSHKAFGKMFYTNKTKIELSGLNKMCYV